MRRAPVFALALALALTLAAPAARAQSSFSGSCDESGEYHPPPPFHDSGDGAYACGDERPPPLLRGEPRPLPRYPERHGLGGRASAGGVYGGFLGLSFYGAAAALAFGGDLGREIDLYGSVTYARTRTANGLGADNATLDLNVEWVKDRLRLGPGLGLGYLIVRRISEPGATIDRFGLCGFLSASVDLVPTGKRQALYLAARPELDLFSGNWLARAAVALGYRF